DWMLAAQSSHCKLLNVQDSYRLKRSVSAVRFRPLSSRGSPSEGGRGHPNRRAPTLRWLRLGRSEKMLRLTNRQEGPSGNSRGNLRHGVLKNTSSRTLVVPR